MSTGRTRLFYFIAIATIVSLGCYGCKKPAETPNSPGPSSSGETGTSSGQGLTAEAAQELLPSAASMSSADFEKLASGQTVPGPDSIKNKTLSFVLLTLNPLKASAENQAALEDFNFSSGNAPPQLSDIAAVIYKSKAKGYATFLQPDLITHCTCDSDGDTASGFVTFHAPDLFAGKVEFIARRKQGKWQIEEFHLPNYGIKTVRGDDNQWHQSGIDDPANTTESTEAKKSESAPAAESTAVAPPALTTAEARALVPQASSMSNADFKKFSGPEGNPTANGFESQSLSLVLMTLDPAKAGAKNPEIFNDFQYLSGFTLDRFAEAVTGTQAQGYATLIQPQFITHGSCQTDKDQARGFVTFHAKDLYSGKVHFLARYHEGTWRIEQFQLPVYGIKLSLDKQENWQHAAVVVEQGTELN
ncbi:MAG: hypothetical protein OSB47_11160 [Pirellulaceae bacterium]|nr:hypothetical protein [Pirellulaceae bacterium]